MFTKRLLLRLVVLVCTPALAQAQLAEEDKLSHIEASIVAVNTFNETLTALTNASESEFESLYKKLVVNKNTAISETADIQSDLTVKGMVQRNQQMISTRYYFEVYNMFYSRDTSAAQNLKYLNWQLQFNEGDSLDLPTAKARVLTSYNGHVQDEAPLSTLVFEFDLTYKISSKTKAVTCEIVGITNSSEFVIPGFTDEFAQKYITRIPNKDDAKEAYKALFTPLVENNSLYYNRAINNQLQRADSLFEAKQYGAAKDLLDEASSLNKKYLTRKYSRAQRDNIADLQSDIEKAETLEQQQRLNKLQLRLETAKELAQKGEIPDALVLMEELIAQKHELDQTEALRQRWSNEQQMVDRVVEELKQGNRLWALEDFLSDSLPTHIHEYLKGVDFYENVTGEIGQRSHMLDQSQKALLKSTNNNKDYIPAYALRVDVNKAILALNPAEKAIFIDEIYDDYEKLSSTSEHRVKYAREAYDYYEQIGKHENAVEMLSQCWDMTRMDLAGMTNIAFLLSEQHAFDGRENKANKVLSELLEVDGSLRKNPQYWEARLKVELITGTQESKEATISDFRSQFDTAEIAATNNNLHDFFNGQGDKALALDHYAEAMNFYQANQLIDPTLKDDLRLGTTANAIGKYVYAESIFRSSLTRHPDSDQLYLAHANNLLDAGLGSYDLAKLEAIAYKPEAGIEENMTYLRAVASLNKKTAKAHLKHIKVTFPEMKNQQIYAKFLYQWYGKRNFDKATKFLDKYTSRTNTGKAYFELACWYMGFNSCFEREFVMTKQATKNKSTAIKKFEEAAKVNEPISPWMLNRYLANIYMQEEDFKKAIKKFDLATEFNEEDIESKMKKALIHFYDDDYDECSAAVADIPLLDFVEFCRQPDNYGKEVLGVRILIHIGADYIAQEDTQRSTKEIEEFRKISEDNASITLGSEAPLAIANVGYWFILKKDESKDENADLAKVLSFGLPQQWLNLELFEKTEVYKALNKNSNFKRAWKTL